MTSPENMGRQFLTYYHGTSAHAAESIMKEGFQGHTYLHPDEDITHDYGDHVFKVRIPADLTIVDRRTVDENHGYNTFVDHSGEERPFHGHFDENYNGQDIVVHDPKNIQIVGKPVDWGKDEWHRDTPEDRKGTRYNWDNRPDKWHY